MKEENALTVTVLASDLELVYGPLLDDESGDLRSEYDYLSDEEFADAYFFQHAGLTYSLGDFLKTEDVPGYHAAYGESAFSALYIALSDDQETVTLARVTA